MAKKVQYKFDPFRISGESRRGLSKSKQNEVLKEVAEFILDKVGEKIDSSVSPVSRQRGFKDLKAGGASVLRESGDLRDSQRIKKSGDGLVHTVLTSQQPKADNHNKFSAASKRTPVPRRQFIPNKANEQTYKKDIIDGIAKIIKEKKSG
jgi:hypothetical protein